MQEYQSNSHKSKREAVAREQEERREIKPVVTSKVKKRKNRGREVKSLLFSDNAGSVWSYALLDVLVPAFKKSFYDIIVGGADRIIYGDDSRSRGGGKRSGGSKVSYRSYYDDRDRRDRDYEPRTRSRRFDYEDIIYDTRGDAEAVLRGMREALERYDFVTVADQYDLSNESIPHTASKYGWDSLRDAYVDRVRDGYIIKLPPATPL